MWINAIVRVVSQLSSLFISLNFSVNRKCGQQRKIFVLVNVNTSLPKGSESNVFWNPFSKQRLCYLQYWLHNPWVSTHAQVVIATPNGHLPLILQRACKVVSHGELVGQAIHCFEHTVSVVALLFHNLLLKKVIVIEAGHCDRGRVQCLLNVMDEAMPQLMKFSVHLNKNEVEVTGSWLPMMLAHWFCANPPYNQAARVHQ